MNYLGIDYGEKNIGLAFGDDELKIAMPLKTAHNLEDINKIIEERRVDKIILGLPLGFRGETKQTKKTKEFAKNFKNYEFIDEKMTSKISGSHSGAAALILQTYLDKL